MLEKTAERDGMLPPHYVFEFKDDMWCCTCSYWLLMDVEVPGSLVYANDRLDAQELAAEFLYYNVRYFSKVLGTRTPIDFRRTMCTCL